MYTVNDLVSDLVLSGITPRPSEHPRFRYMEPVLVFPSNRQTLSLCSACHRVFALFTRLAYGMVLFRHIALLRVVSHCIPSA